MLFRSRHDDGAWHVFVTTADGKGVEKLTDGPGWNIYAAWSPDGRYIAYTHYAGPPGVPGSEHGQLVIRDLIEDNPTPAALAGLKCGNRLAWKPKEH